MTAKLTKQKHEDQKHEAVLALRLATERQRILGKFQDRANCWLERSFEYTLSDRYKLEDGYCRGLEHGYISAYQLVAIWLQEEINQIKEEGKNQGKGDEKLRK